MNTAMYINKAVRISCSENQLINTKEMKELYRSGVRISKQNGNSPIIVDLKQNVKLSCGARRLFNRISKMENKITFVIVSG